MNKKVVWTPLPGSQTLAMSCPAHIMLYHGSRGPGKTDAQLMRFRRRVGQGYGRHWRGVIFDRRYKNLDDLVSKSQRWFPEFKDGARFLSSKSDFRWVWPSGEELLFRTASRDEDYWDYHGQEFPFIGWNELTKYPTDTLFEALMSCNRSSFRPEDHPLYYDGSIYDKTGRMVLCDEWHRHARSYLIPPIPLEVFATCNPFGAGHNWVKKRFIDVAPPGRFHRVATDVFNPRTQKRQVIEKVQTHIFGTYKENKYLDPEYVAELEKIKDPNKRKAWLGGSWDVVAGGMFDDVWDQEQHFIAPFNIPHHWKIDRSFDYGSSRPFSVGWWAESDGSDVQLPDGTWMSTVKGDLFRIGEWYGSTGKANEGLRMLASEITRGIVVREIRMGIHGRAQPGPADNSIFDLMNGNSIAADMQKEVVIDGKVYNGVWWRRSDKSPGSRKSGWERVRSYLENAKVQYARDDDGQLTDRRVPRTRPGMYVFNTCTDFLELFPCLPRDEVDPDDVDTESEDHLGDEVRYKILSTNTGARTGKTRGT
ncbi:terminase large subunit [Pseudomonas phage Iggy]|uniref:Terminase large subunit n=1 Tax=Pseudomonas phage Iggy TaxID=2592193 RepID=A0A7S5AYT4_9CAUD|nr:terminase large subunit [Pseudomonas phage Iggy]QEA09735.1 terminase large subunit [Pseudomonas phage Iggy]